MSKKADAMFLDIFSILALLGAILSAVGVTAKVFGLTTFSWLIVLFPALFPWLAFSLLMLASLLVLFLRKTYEELYGDEG